jgi:hypothetical protein
VTGTARGTAAEPQPQRCDPTGLQNLFGIVAKYLALAAALVGFVVIATREVTLPGIYYDEVIQLTPALTFSGGSPASLAAGVGEPRSHIDLFGRPLPLMVMDYIGAVKTIAFIPVLAVVDLTPTTVRAFHIAVAALSLLATYLFTRRLFGREAVALVAIALLATDPSFLFFSRSDLGPVVFMFLAKSLALWQLVDWWRTGSVRSLVVGSFILGLGVYDKANFLWVIAAAAAAAAVIDWERAWSRIRERSFVLAPLAFLIGCLPLVLHNLTWPPRTLEALSAVPPGANGGLGDQLLHRVDLLVGLLNGEEVSRWIGDGFAPLPVLSVYFGAAALAGVVLLAYGATRREARPLAFVLLSGFLVVAAAAATPGGFAAHHVILAYPFPHVAVAAVIVNAGDLRRRRLRPRPAWTRLAVVASLAALPVAAGVTTDLRIYDALSQTGGRGNFSDAIYDLNGHLVAHARDRRIVVLDWGIGENLFALSQGKLRIKESFWALIKNGRAPVPVLESALAQPGNRFVLHTPEATNFPTARAGFAEAVRATGREAHLERGFRTKIGHPVLEVYTVGPREQGYLRKGDCNRSSSPPRECVAGKGA